MPVLPALIDAIRSGAVQIVDLTAPLSSDTPVIKLPEPFGNTANFSLHEISHYDERGPGWYWNNFSTGEHTGTHFDAPVHWVTGSGLDDVAEIPVARLIAPAAVLDFTGQAAANPDFLLEVEHIVKWESEHGPLPEGGWLLYRTGWDARSHGQQEFLNADEAGPHTPGMSVECARWVAAEAPVIGIGVETVGTDAGTGKYGLTQLQNLSRLPAQGAAVIAGPLPIRGGSGSPARVLALIEGPAQGNAQG